jgi:hypothetical protein
VSGALDRILDRVAQNQTAQREAAADAASSRPFVSRLGGGQFLAADRVFDTVSGQPGTVYATRTPTTAEPRSVSVLLEVGTFVWREPSQFVLRPTPPAPKPEAR